MARVTISNRGEFERKLKSIIDKKQKQVIKDLEKYLVGLNDILGEKFASSKEFNDIKGPLRGEFGFTDQEVAKLDSIINVIKKDNSVTKISASKDRVILEWVDFRVLKDHQLAQHELTKLNTKTGLFEVVQTVSWVDWLENGLSITGYDFSEAGGKNSRSKQGIMKEESGLFKLPKTKVFEKIAKSIDKKTIKAGIATILEKKVR